MEQEGDEKLKSLQQADRHLATGEHQTIEMPIDCNSTHPVVHLTFLEVITCLCEATQ